jgi:GNAT superfamily N-acetyltransferase
METLWRASLPPEWPVLPNALDGLRAGAVAEVGGEAAAIAAWSGSALQLLLVDPGHRRLGVGSALFEVAMAASA